jgi:hypothetical protein
MDSSFLDIGICWRRVFRFTPRPIIPPGKEALVGLNWSERCTEKKILDLAGTRTPTLQSSSQQPVALPTELFRILL